MPSQVALRWTLSVSGAPVCVFFGRRFSVELLSPRVCLSSKFCFHSALRVYTLSPVRGVCVLSPRTFCLLFKLERGKNPVTRGKLFIFYGLSQYFLLWVSTNVLYSSILNCIGFSFLIRLEQRLLCVLFKVRNKAEQRCSGGVGRGKNWCFILWPLPSANFPSFLPWKLQVWGFDRSGLDHTLI